MRSFAARFDSIPVPADTHSLVVLAAATPQAFDWPDGTHVARLTGTCTNSSAPFAFVVNPVSTFAVWGSSFAASTASSGQNIVITADTPKMFRVPDASTGFSLSAPVAGLVNVEFWKIGG